MVDKIESDLPMQSARREVGGELPEVIVDPLPPPIFFPEESPRRQIKDDKVHIWKGSAGESGLDFLSPLAMREDPDTVKSSSLEDGVPAHTRLRAPPWYA